MSVGIGVNSGLMVVGSIGSEQRMKYNVIGSSMNLVARIESLVLGWQILISEATRREVEEYGRDRRAVTSQRVRYRWLWSR